MSSVDEKDEISSICNRKQLLEVCERQKSKNEQALEKYSSLVHHDINSSDLKVTESDPQIHGRTFFQYTDDAPLEKSSLPYESVTQVIVTPRLTDGAGTDRSPSRLTASPAYLSAEGECDDVEEEIVPILQFDGNESPTSVKTNAASKRLKKSGKSKKVKKAADRLSIRNEPSRFSYASGGGGGGGGGGGVTKIQPKKKRYARLVSSTSKSTISYNMAASKKNERRKLKRQRSLTLKALDKSTRPSLHPNRRPRSLKSQESKKSKVKNPSIVQQSKVSKSDDCDASATATTRKNRRAPSPVYEKSDEVEDITYEDFNYEDTETRFLKQQQLVENVYTVASNEGMTKVHDENENEAQTSVVEKTETLIEIKDSFQSGYAKPTFSSKGKRVDQQQVYKPRFHVPSIPFVVGTSLSPSHHLGLNIQQVLSLIKVKQPQVPAISSILMRTMSQGIRPVSSIIKEINHQYSEYQPPELESNLYCTPQIPSKRQKSPVIESRHTFDCETLVEEDEEDEEAEYDEEKRAKGRLRGSRSSHRQERKTQSVPNVPSRVKSSLASRCGSKISTNNSNNNEEMTDVLKRLHNEFEFMIKRQKYLADQLKIDDDEELSKELEDLEDSLHDKEKEIKAIANLYREVMSLKRQMNQNYDRNGFVCISTADENAFHQRYKIGDRTSLMRTGLLRQIQDLHRRLTKA